MAAVDTWARDLATEAKELASSTATQLSSHEKQCLERHADMRARHENSERKLDTLRRDLWMLTISGLLMVLGAFATLIVKLPPAGH